MTYGRTAAAFIRVILNQKLRAPFRRDEFHAVASGQFCLIDQKGFAREFKAGGARLILNGFLEVNGTSTKHIVTRSHGIAE